MSRADVWRQAQIARYGENLIGAPKSVLTDPRWYAMGELPHTADVPWAGERSDIKPRPGKPQKPAPGAPRGPLSIRSPSGRVVQYPAPVIDPLTGKAVPPPGFKVPYPKPLEKPTGPGPSAKPSGPTSGLAAFGVAELSVHAIDSMGGDYLKRGIAKLTGADPEYIKNIPILTLKQRLKKLASPATGLVELGEIGTNKLSLALGLRDPTHHEASEEAHEKRIAQAKEAGETGFGKHFKDIRRAETTKVGKHEIPPGTWWGKVKENKKPISKINILLG